MSRIMQTIFIDTGNTMRTVEQDPAHQYHARQEIVKLLSVSESPDDFCNRLTERYDAYKLWARETLLQTSEAELWTRWMLPEYQPDKIFPIADRLTRLWLEQRGRRIPRPDLRPTVIELHKRGYILGIIANAISTTEIPDWLQADGLAGYFKVVVLSCRFGRRKPDPYIFLEASRLAGVEPAQCVYVGDNPERDIQGARQAGYGEVLIMLEPATLKKEPPKGRNRPDGIISRFGDLLNFFPPREQA